MRITEEKYNELASTLQDHWDSKGWFNALSEVNDQGCFLIPDASGLGLTAIKKVTADKVYFTAMEYCGNPKSRFQSSVDPERVKELQALFLNYKDLPQLVVGFRSGSVVASLGDLKFQKHWSNSAAFGVGRTELKCAMVEYNLRKKSFCRF